MKTGALSGIITSYTKELQMTLEIQPCPFCGGTNFGITCDVEDREGTPTHITCDDCGCSGPWSYMEEPTKQPIEVVAELTGWNMRMV